MNIHIFFKAIQTCRFQERRFIHVLNGWNNLNMHSMYEHIINLYL